MDFIKIGYVIGPHGLDGTLKILPITDNLDLFCISEHLLLSSNSEEMLSLSVEKVRKINRFLLIKCRGLDSIEASSHHKKSDVMFPRALLPEESDDEIYWHNLCGATVVDKSDSKIGEVVDYIECGSSDVFRIKGFDKIYYLISNNPDHVLKIDKEEHYIVIDRIGLVSE